MRTIQQVSLIAGLSQNFQVGARSRGRNWSRRAARDPESRSVHWLKRSSRWLPTLEDGENRLAAGASCHGDLGTSVALAEIMHMGIKEINNRWFKCPVSDRFSFCRWDRRMSETPPHHCSPSTKDRRSMTGGFSEEEHQNWASFTHVHKSFMCNSQKVEAARASTGGREDKHNAVYTHDEIGFTREREGNPETHYNMSELGEHDARWNKTTSNRWILVDSAYMRCLE